MLRRVVACVALVGFGVVGVAQSYEFTWPDRLEHHLRALQGTWQGAGEIRGLGPVVATLTFSRDEGAPFFRCEQVVRTDDEVITDYGFFYLRFNPRTLRPELRALWVTGRGYLLQGRGEVKDGGLVFTLDTTENLPPGIRGRSRLTHLDDDRLQLTLEFGIPTQKLKQVVSLTYERVSTLAQTDSGASKP